VGSKKNNFIIIMHIKYIKETRNRIKNMNLNLFIV